MPHNITEAERMLNLFTSVGARSFIVTKLDLEQKLIWAKTYSAVEFREKLPAMVRTAAARKPYTLASGRTVMSGENLIVRPVGDAAFIQLDDLSAEQLERVKRRRCRKGRGEGLHAPGAHGGGRFGQVRFWDDAHRGR